MIIPNGGFETGIIPDGDLSSMLGVPAIWAAAIDSITEEVAVFNPGDRVDSRERFERDWDSPIVAEFTEAMLDGIPVREPFEYGWFVGQRFFGLGPLAAAVFDTTIPEALEDFEEDWSTAPIFDFTETDIVDGDDDGFESVAVLDDFASTEAASFDNASTVSVSAASPNIAERFILRAPQLITSVSIADDELNTSPHAAVGVVNDSCSLVTSGTLPTPLNPGTNYLVKTIAGVTITLKATVGGAVVNLTDAGIGQHHLVADPGRFWIEEMTS